MNNLVEYWYIFIALIAVLIVAIIMIYNFTKLPKNEQIVKINNWLEYAIVAAEKELGSGTGQIKLRMVYDMFVGRFPTVAKMITFDTFSSMVDSALITVKRQLKENKSLSEYVYGTENNINNDIIALEDVE